MQRSLWQLDVLMLARQLSAPKPADSSLQNVYISVKILMSKQTYTQEELIVLVKDRDQKAFSYLYDGYSKALFHVVNYILNDVEEAEDVIQHVFLKIWNNFDSYDSAKGRLYTWMLNIARNLAIDSKRSKHQKIKSKIQNTNETVYGRNNLFVENNAHETIGFKNILSGLKDDQQLVIKLAYYEGYTQEEISKKLNMPLGTVKTKVRQAILTLRDLTKKEFLQ